MFDVSFAELALILVVGLLVFGPEKLPEVIRTVSMWIAKIKRSFTTMRTEIEREIGVDEIKRDLHNNSIMQKLRDVQHDLQRKQQELQQLPYDVSDVVQRANSSAPSPVETSTQATAEASPSTPATLSTQELLPDQAPLPDQTPLPNQIPFPNQVIAPTQVPATEQLHTTKQLHANEQIHSPTKIQIPAHVADSMDANIPDNSSAQK